VSDIGRVIHEIRRGLGFTQADLGRSLGVKRNTVSQYESGLAEPSAQVLMRLYDVAVDRDEKRFVLSHLAKLAGCLSDETMERLVRLSERPQEVGELPSTLEAERSRELRLLGVKPSGATARKLLLEVLNLANRERDIEPVMLEMVRLYRRSAADRKARRAAFHRAIEYLRIQLADFTKDEPQA
jgi:transcriptional regulator with XRE-family HTH domain